MACIYPTAPFVTAEKLRTSFLMLVEKEAELVMPVVPFSYPPQRGWISDGEQIKMKYPEHQSSRSQDLEIIYHDCGQFYFHKVREFMEKRDMKEMKIIPMIMNELEVQDIDNEIDWRMAEMKYRMMMEAVHGEKVF